MVTWNRDDKDANKLSINLYRIEQKRLVYFYKKVTQSFNNYFNYNYYVK